MMSTQQRQPKGTEAGGQFASSHNPEAIVHLAEDRKPEGPELDLEDSDFEIATFEHQGLPVATFSHLVHVGSLKEDMKRGWSLEGDGLSVSTEPEAWEEIATLGGSQWWTFTRDGNVFLDAHELTDEQRSSINNWGIERGYLARQNGWQIEWFDEEMDDTMTTVLDSEDEAREELDSMEINQEPVLVERLVAGPNFPDEAGALNADQVILSVWAEEMSDFDGVWWNDDLAPEHLSAPRAVILKSRLAMWTHARGLA
jgi:hypothetical protein